MIVGVDTHKDFHVAAVITALGVLLATKTFPTTRAGYQALVKWARGFGVVQRAGVECTGSYGAALARHLAAAHIDVFEVNQPDKANRRRRGKNDTIDAESAARSVLNGQASALAKSGQGPVEMLRVFKVAKTSAVKSRTQAINQLKAVLVSADPVLRDELRELSTAKLVQRCIEWAPTTPCDSATAARFTLRLLACRIDRLSQEITDLNAQIAAVLADHNPAILDAYGVGPDTAATLLIAAGDNSERLRSEASFAALCGVSPVEASSGRTQRHRLNRGGDRQANCALRSIVLVRLRWDQRTRDYIDRRVCEGKTKREAVRCLKRYIARELYRVITSPDHRQRHTRLLDEQ
ncbi:IS110 family transposase [Umezawaea endophytica]|uniref:IS110 family transposase n=1 Tax=Umezawaea endophytica TaxID=1654476 RepID=A0A9X2VHR9_9PSEU|nr:IS110 family transposase [Umezawaea endophytica]MCS7476975.1 IS110 family transposase [Umezawaea endophytica]